jgi:hypothetical protein
VAGGEPVELSEFGVDGGEVDFESFDLAEPTLLLGLVDPVGEVVVDLPQPGSLGWVGPKEGTAHATVLMNTVGSVCASAVAEGDSATFEVSLHLSS